MCVLFCPPCWLRDVPSPSSDILAHLLASWCGWRSVWRTVSRHTRGHVTSPRPLVHCTHVYVYVYARDAGRLARSLVCGELGHAVAARSRRTRSLCWGRFVEAVTIGVVLRLCLHLLLDLRGKLLVVGLHCSGGASASHAGRALSRGRGWAEAGGGSSTRRERRHRRTAAALQAART